jgi:hypothetical protein
MQNNANNIIIIINNNSASTNLYILMTCKHTSFICKIPVGV